MKILLHTILLLRLLFYAPGGILHASLPPGQAIGWGENTAGEATGIPSYPFIDGKVIMVGNSSATGTVVVAGQVLSNIIAICAGMSHSLALKSDGCVVGFGNNINGEALGMTNEYPYRGSAQIKIDGQVLSNVVSIVVGRNFSLALKKNGTVITWGENIVPDDLSNVVAIAAAGHTSLALRYDGTIVRWESWKSFPQYGQLQVIPNLSNIVSIAIGETYQGTRNAALKSNGTVAIWGEETIYKDATPPVGLSNVVAIAVGSAHTLALRKDGTVVGWGFNQVGEATGVPTTNDSWISHGAEVRINGQILSNVVSIAANRGYSLALKGDGTIVAWGRMVNGLYPVTVPAGLSNIVAISAGDNYCLAITTNTAVATRFRQK